MDDPDLGVSGYDEPLDSDWIDHDPDFRTTLRFLNDAGVHTVSSCQGHAPGTHPFEPGWVDPYLTCRVNSAEDFARACALLESIGGEIRESSVGKVRAQFPRGWNWKQSVAALEK